MIPSMPARANMAPSRDLGADSLRLVVTDDKCKFAGSACTVQKPSAAALTGQLSMASEESADSLACNIEGKSAHQSR